MKVARMERRFQELPSRKAVEQLAEECPDRSGYGTIQEAGCLRCQSHFWKKKTLFIRDGTFFLLSLLGNSHVVSRISTFAAP